MRKLTLVLAPLLLAGCFTISETEYPAVQSSLVEKDVKLQLQGFTAKVLTYTTSYSYTTSMVMMPAPPPRRHGRSGHHYDHYTMEPVVSRTETLIPTMETTDVYLRRAQDILEKAGCNIRATPADYTVSLEFGGPFEPDGSVLKTACVQLGSLLFATWNSVSYTAAVRIHDVKTGKLVFSQDYSQNYTVSGWSPLWVLGMAEFNKDTYNHMQAWCESALIDRSMCDVTSFFAQTASAK